MANIFLISDTHFGHQGMCEFVNADQTKVRPWTNADEMDEALIAAWNAVVKPGDKVYHLGDVVISRKVLPRVMPRLHGKKVLIKGNHDIFKLTDYTPWFYDIRAYHRLADYLLLSHMPVHENQLRRFPVNVHGHMHTNIVMKDGQPDPRYLSVCVEQLPNWAPASLEWIISKRPRSS